MERILLKLLFMSSLAAAPLIFKRKHIFILLTTFFAKAVLSTAIDSYFVKSKKISYPVRPFAKVFDTNILYDLLFYPLLSVIWIRWTYNAKPRHILSRSLCFSVPMSIAQWVMEKKTNLFNWKEWSIWHTFAWINVTLFTIRGFVGLVRRYVENTVPLTSKKSGTGVLSTMKRVIPFDHLFSYQKVSQHGEQIHELRVDHYEQQIQ
ncbi:CBO0543 family protein [Paenibacillus sp. N3.4]|uniref:CBO0543 family protein n=1 Tax=Paenibacillus sp. N3.4 TaxID=2603222 RepID=UPI00164F1438|nr:CBO0543 family protein [Paenibacillus sp. N3.4]